MRTALSSVIWAAWLVTVSFVPAAQSSVETIIHDPVAFQERSVVLRPVVYHYSMKKKPEHLPPPPPEPYVPPEIPVESEPIVESFESDPVDDYSYSQEEDEGSVLSGSSESKLVTESDEETSESVDVVGYVPEEVDVVQTLNQVDQIEKSAEMVTEASPNLFNVEDSASDLSLQSSNEIMEASVGLNYVATRKCKKAIAVAVAKVNEL